jgi:hypothetical protein
MIILSGFRYEKNSETYSFAIIESVEWSIPSVVVHSKAGFSGCH